jgi:D-glycero-alpha-D-manno-heptose 1-phosphate guanylyltransferase
MSAASQAIILAGGFGTRLRSVVSDVPKPLAPVGGRPFLAYLLDELQRQGMEKVVLATGYMGDTVRKVVGTSWSGMRVGYSQEETALGTGGAIALASRQIDTDAYFVLNGDTHLRLDYASFDRHVDKFPGAMLGLALAHVPDVSRYGAVSVAADGRVAGFSEKGREGAGYINAGVYRLTRGVEAGYPPREQFSFESEVLLPMAGAGQVAAFVSTSGFIDIGVPEDYARADAVLAAFSTGAEA